MALSPSTIVRLAAAALVATAGTVHAREASEPAVEAAVTDGLSTALGIAVGAAEMNPLGPVLALGMKAAVFQYASTLPDVEQPKVYAAAASFWGGATANNLCIAAALVSGGTFAPACVALGVAWGMKTWQESEHERLFWEGCAMLRAYANEPELKCIYSPPAPGTWPVEARTALVPREIEAP